MKILFILDEEEPRDSQKLKELSKNTDMMVALWDINQMFRNTLKYENMIHDGYLTDEEYSAIEKTRDKYLEILEEYDITKLILEMP